MGSLWVYLLRLFLLWRLLPLRLAISDTPYPFLIFSSVIARLMRRFVVVDSLWYHLVFRSLCNARVFTSPDLVNGSIPVSLLIRRLFLLSQALSAPGCLIAPWIHLDLRLGTRARLYYLLR